MNQQSDEIPAPAWVLKFSPDRLIFQPKENEEINM